MPADRCDGRAGLGAGCPRLAASPVRCALRADSPWDAWLHLRDHDEAGHEPDGTCSACFISVEAEFRLRRESSCARAGGCERKESDPAVSRLRARSAGQAALTASATISVARRVDPPWASEVRVFRRPSTVTQSSPGETTRRRSPCEPQSGPRSRNATGAPRSSAR
jgi:hypothetical protein